MSSKNDGGPAFPSEQGHTPEGTWNQTYDPGMSLRDWFAGQTLAALMPDFIPGTTPHAGAYWDSIARDAFACADAMLRAREKGGK